MPGPAGDPADVTAADGIEFGTGDLDSGVGVDAAVEGVQTVVHCAGSAKGDADKARTLVRAATAAGVGHIVYISVVGAERVPVMSRLDGAMFGYFEMKLAGERIVAESGIPWTTLRASQFHELTLTTTTAMTKLPVIPVPAGVCFQPVDVDEVAARLAELALDRPAGLVADIAGPTVYGLDELVRSYLRHRGRTGPSADGPGGTSWPPPEDLEAVRAIRTGDEAAPTR